MPSFLKKLFRPGAYAQAQREAEDAANAKRIEAGDGLAFHEFPDYETYRAVQDAGNKTKIKKQFVKESHIQRLAEHLNARDKDVDFGLCHGTRRGNEQNWFRKHLNGTPNVIGTEISDTASQFPHTVQWDFHETNPEWQDRADFVYTNSWDHAYAPAKAMRAWVGSLRPGGVMLLDHTSGHEPQNASALDPFGATYEALLSFLQRELGDLGSVTGEVDGRDNPDYQARTVIFTRNG